MTDRQRAEAYARALVAWLEQRNEDKHGTATQCCYCDAGEDFYPVLMYDDLADAIEAVEDEFRRDANNDEHIGGGDE